MAPYSRSRSVSAVAQELGFSDAIDNKETIIKLCKNWNDPGVTLNTPMIPLNQCIKDCKRERMILNDVPFIPHHDYSFRNYGFVETLDRLCTNLGCTDSRAKDIILRSACRTGSGADAYFVIQSLFTTSDTVVAQRACDDDPPVKVEVFQSSGRICAKIASFNAFSLFLEEDVDVAIEVARKPWLVVETTVHDEIIIGEDHKRWLSLSFFEAIISDDVDSVASSTRIVPLRKPENLIDNIRKIIPFG